jgi:hypothetical protein
MATLELRMMIVMVVRGYFYFIYIKKTNICEIIKLVFELLQIIYKVSRTRYKITNRCT